MSDGLKKEDPTKTPAYLTASEFAGVCQNIQRKLLKRARALKRKFEASGSVGSRDKKIGETYMIAAQEYYVFTVLVEVSEKLGNEVVILNELVQTLQQELSMTPVTPVSNRGTKKLVN